MSNEYKDWCNDREHSLRFVMRDGKRILQESFIRYNELFGKHEVWLDVPLVEEEDD